MTLWDEKSQNYSKNFQVDRNQQMNYLRKSKKRPVNLKKAFPYYGNIINFKKKNENDNQCF